MEITVIHHVPIEDLIEHELDEMCVCGPTPDRGLRIMGRLDWVFTHHSLDGRELVGEG